MPGRFHHHWLLRAMAAGSRRFRVSRVSGLGCFAGGYCAIHRIAKDGFEELSGFTRQLENDRPHPGLALHVVEDFGLCESPPCRFWAYHPWKVARLDAGWSSSVSRADS